jgi:uncharacterized protein
MSLVRLLFLCTVLGIPSAFLAGTARSAAAQEKQPAKAQEDPAKRKLRKVHELLASMKTREISERSMDVMLEAAGAPKEYAEKFKGQFDFDGMIDSTAEIYAKHLEEDAIDALQDFYKTELGKKVAAAMPEITIESMKAGQEYGKRAAEGMGTGK